MVDFHKNCIASDGMIASGTLYIAENLPTVFCLHFLSL